MWSPIPILALLIVSVESRVCSSLDVRNTPDHISDFRDCRVIQGHLKLVLMERIEDDPDYFNRSFSELYEITDYLIIFRVMGLSSLRTIFPKLASIRGEKLFLGYSLILYELDDLEEIGLTSLRSIGRGGLKINSCPKLCYVDTVNWKAIGITHMTYDDRTKCTEEWCPKHCGGNCWNTYECQTLGKSQCHQLCIGCTKTDSPKDCSLCKYFNDTGACVQTCPKPKLIDNDSSRCIQSEDCISKDGTWSIFKGECVKKCPLWYERDATGQCKPSKVRSCPGIRINNREELQKMIGCTHINGSLDIALSGYLDTDQLELALGSIVSISENLKILRSTAITTLEFFKSLTTIQGDKLWGKYYSLFIIENPNLQKLFHKNSSLVIKKGEAFLQNNPYLCPCEYKKIKVDVTAYGNGNETICDLTELNVTIVTNNPTNVTLMWPTLANRTILGYTVYYIKIPDENFSLVQVKDGFVDRDGDPSGDGWSSTFVPNNTVLLKKLTPYTNYRYYIKTNSISERDSAQTPIYSFKSAIGEPSEPVDLETESSTPTTVNLKWRAPRYINGNLSHYKLAVYEVEDDEVLIMQRNYCLHPHRENNCNCPQSVEVHLFHKEAICVGNGDNYCNTQTTYYTDTPQAEPTQKLRIQKRSLNVSEDLQEFLINVTKNSEQIYMLTGLRPYTLYSFFLRACNDKEDDEEHQCGAPTMRAQRTLKRNGADVVTDVNVTVSNKTVIVNWRRPKDPNSILLAYRIEYKKQNSKIQQECRTSREFASDRSEFNISGLEDGRYKLRVRVVSLAGSGEMGQWYNFRIGNVTKRGSNGMNWLYGFLIVLAVVVVIFLGVVIWRRYRGTRGRQDHSLVYRMRFERDSEEDEWNLDEETVEIIKELGQNAVGMIYRKQAAGKETREEF